MSDPSIFLLCSFSPGKPGPGVTQSVLCLAHPLGPGCALAQPPTTGSCWQGGLGYLEAGVKGALPGLDFPSLLLASRSF